MALTADRVHTWEAISGQGIPWMMGSHAGLPYRLQHLSPGRVTLRGPGLASYCSNQQA
jgi:hypothetical protein